MKISCLSSCLSVLLFSLLSFNLIGQQKAEEKPPETIEELKKSILQVMEETGTPGAGVAVKTPDGDMWIAGLGLADVEKKIPADKETIFRIGSTSKIFVALAILKLQEEGKLSLKDKVKDIIPEIKFENQWADTNPVLVEHLLEHTTGWDDLHLSEIGNDDSPIIGLKEALELHPHSRKSKWIPGTRMAYSNIGPNVAAYIVEKVSGKEYEQYIQENFFDPIGMETATFFQSEDYKRKGATLYRGDYPAGYDRMLMRASGSINASPKDMAKFLEFMINRGTMDSTKIMSVEAFDRMETPSTTLGAKAGLAYGYGLGLYTSRHEHFNYYKHGGGVAGGISDFSYLPEYGVGYSILINSRTPAAIFRIGDLIRSFQTQNFKTPTEQLSADSGINIPDSLDGYYKLISPISTPIDFPNFKMVKVWSQGDTLYRQYPAHLGKVDKYVAAGDNFFRSVDTGMKDLVFVNDPLVDLGFEIANRSTGTLSFGKTSPFLMVLKIFVMILWVIFALRALLMLPIWSIRKWRGKIPGGVNVKIRLWVLLPVILAFVSLVSLMGGLMNGPEGLEKPTFVSISIMAFTLLFFISAIFSLFKVLQFSKSGIKKSVYIPAAALAILHVLLAIFLASHDLIGLRTWA